MRFSSLAACAALLVAPAAAQPVEAPSPRPPVDWSAAQSIEVRLQNFSYQPASLTLRANVPYRIHFVNVSSGGHNFTAKEFFAQATIDPEDQAAAQGGSVKLDGGQSVDVRVIAHQPGRYKTHCTHFLHSSLGMTGEILVQ
jgi:plastocyanin